MSNQGDASPASSEFSGENVAKDWEKSKRTLEEYRKETMKTTTSLSKLIAIMGRIMYNEAAAGQIKRVALQAMDMRELCQQHSMQINQLESWLEGSGIDLSSPPPAPRRPPVKRARLSDSIESEPTIAEWCRQVKVEELNITNKCVPCVVKLPNSLNRLLKTISKKTRRDIAEVCNNFQHAVGDENQGDHEIIEEPMGILPVRKNEPSEKETKEPIQELLLQQPEDDSRNVEGTSSALAGQEKRQELLPKSPRRCAANFEGPTEPKEEERLAIPVPLDDIFEFQYNEADEGNKMRRVTFRICDYVDAVARRVFLDPWIPYGYSGEEQIKKVVEVSAEGAIREVNRRYVAQPWRQFKGTPFHYTQEVDVTYILPSGRLLTVPLGYIKSQTKSTSFGQDFMLTNSVKVQLSRSSGEGIILIKGEPVPCALIKSGPIRPDDHDWKPRQPLRPDQSSVVSFAQRRLENYRANLAEKVQEKEE